MDLCSSNLDSLRLQDKMIAFFAALWNFFLQLFVHIQSDLYFHIYSKTFLEMSLSEAQLDIKFNADILGS